MSGKTASAKISYFPETIDQTTEHTLVIGEVARWAAEVRFDAARNNVQCINIGALTSGLLSVFKPEIILSPLVSPDFDAIDVARKLVSFDYQGKYRVIADQLPNPKLIRKEIKSVARELDFDILLMAQDAAVSS